MEKVITIQTDYFGELIKNRIVDNKQSSNITLFYQLEPASQEFGQLKTKDMTQGGCKPGVVPLAIIPHQIEMWEKVEREDVLGEMIDYWQAIIEREITESGYNVIWS